MCSANLENSQVVLSTTVLSMLAAVLAVERDREKGGNFDFFYPSKRAPLCGFTTRTSRCHYTACTHRAVKALEIVGVSSLASRELGKQEYKFENLTPFSFLSLSPTHAATITSS